jgi:hypothetical protein
VYEGLTFADETQRRDVDEAIENLVQHYRAVWPLSDASRDRVVGAPSWWDDDAEADEALALAARIGAEGW